MLRLCIWWGFSDMERDGVPASVATRGSLEDAALRILRGDGSVFLNADVDATVLALPPYPNSSDSLDFPAGVSRLSVSTPPVALDATK
mmetsp:Transcript_18803/g.43729  ORF Transcript_18803/g.43729 Transcript_18803/m.43729 type:complete len:88 (-) Transcript_18803:91-354(-)